MARNEKTLLGNAAFGLMGNPNVSSLDIGGYFGWTPDLNNWLNEQAYVRKPLELKVIESPRFFNLMPNPERWHAAFRQLIEVKPTRVEGFNAGLTVATDDHAVGGAGEMHQEPVDVKRARSTPTFHYVEKYGRPIQRMLDIWIRYAIMDPEAKYAMLATLANGRPTDLMADWWSGTILAYECDPSHTRVEKAWLTTNFYPTETGEVSGLRDLNAPESLLRLSIPWSGISATGNGIVSFAEELLNETSIVNANPFNKAAYLTEIAADVRAAEDAGLSANQRDVADRAVMPS